MTELSFLIDLLVNHKLPKMTKEAVIARIKFVEENAQRTARNVVVPTTYTNANLPPHIANQSASTQAAMIRQQMAEGPRPDEQAHIQADSPQPVEVIAQTPATAAALAQRSALMAAAHNGRAPMKTRQFKDR